MALYAFFPFNAAAQEGEACQSGAIIPGEYIVKFRPRAMLGLSQEQRQAAQLRILGNGSEVVFALGALSPNLGIYRLQENNIRSLSSGDIEYALPNRVVCKAQAQGFNISGQVRVNGAGLPAYPRTLVISGYNYFATVHPNGMQSSRYLKRSGRDWVSNKTPQTLSPWDFNGDGLIEIVSMVKDNWSVAVPGGTGNVDFETGHFFPDFRGLFSGYREDIFSSIDDHFYLSSPRRLDVNNDGSVDIVGTWGSSLYMLDGAAPAQPPRFIGTLPASNPTLIDFDKDGILDAVHSSVYRQNDTPYVRYQVFKGTGSNYVALTDFRAQEGNGSVYTDRWLDIADLNADNKYDFIAYFDQEYFPGLIKFHHNEGNDVDFASQYFQLTNASGAAVKLARITLADLDGDNIPEVLGRTDRSENCPQNSLFILKRQAVSYAIAYVHALNDCGGGIRALDLDGDKKLDIVFGTDNKLHVLLNQSTSASLDFTPILLASTDFYPSHIAAVDPFAVGGVEVTLSHGAAMYRTLSDYDGTFQFKDIPAGTYQLRATHPLYQIESEIGEQVTVTQSRDDIGMQAYVLPPPNPPGYNLPGSAPDDPGFGSMWGLYNSGQSGGLPGYDVKAIDAWTISKGNEGVVVAVLDSGIDYNHPDLRPNIWTNPSEVPKNGVDDDSNGVVDDYFGFNSADGEAGDPIDWDGHGTHVAGTIAARGENGIGVVGVAPHARLMAVRALSARGGSDAMILAGINYIVAQKDRGVNVRVMNASLGGEGTCNQAYLDVLKVLDAKGILFVAAAGNGGADGKGDDNDKSPHYPSNCEHESLIAVANLTMAGNLAPSSNYGLTSVDIGAPGTSILSTWPNGGYNSIDGTSMAAPHVSGVAALLASQEPGLTPQQIKDRILESARTLAQLEGKLVRAGMLNAYEALRLGPVGGPNTPPNNPQPQPPSPPQDVAVSSLQFKPRKNGWGTMTVVISAKTPPSAVWGRVLSRTGKTLTSQALALIASDGARWTYEGKVKLPKVKAAASKKKAAVFSTQVAITIGTQEITANGPDFKWRGNKK